MIEDIIPFTRAGKTLPMFLFIYLLSVSVYSHVIRAPFILGKPTFAHFEGYQTSTITKTGPKVRKSRLVNTTPIMVIGLTPQRWLGWQFFGNFLHNVPGAGESGGGGECYRKHVQLWNMQRNWQRWVHSSTTIHKPEMPFPEQAALPKMPQS